jgi:hypothetical protein
MLMELTLDAEEEEDAMMMMMMMMMMISIVQFLFSNFKVENRGFSLQCPRSFP